MPPKTSTGNGRKKRAEFVGEIKSSDDYKLVRQRSEAVGIPAPGTPDPTDMRINKRPWEDITRDWRCSIREFATKIREEDQLAVEHLKALGFPAEQALAAYEANNRKIDLAANYLLDSSRR